MTRGVRRDGWRVGPQKAGRMTKEPVAQLERQIYDVLSLEGPESVRHMFYRMTDPTLRDPVAKTGKGSLAMGAA